jgi:hypothetical protein
MDEGRNLRPSPALIVAIVALVAAMSGAAVALPGKNTVTSGDIKDAAVKSKDLKRDSVRSKAIKGKTVKGSDVEDDALKGKQIFEDKLEAVPEAKTVQTVDPFGESVVRTAATDGANATAAQAAAPRVALAAKGELSIYGKCFRDVATDVVYGAIYIESSANGAIFHGPTDSLGGGPAATDFLNPATGEDDRELAAANVAAGAAGFDPAAQGSWRAMSPDGTGLAGHLSLALKNGNLAGGNGVYGDGNVCLFGGDAIG